MPTNEQRRQKKLAKQHSKARKANRERAQRKQELTSLAGRMRWASRYPIAFCKISPELLSPPGLGSVVLCRKAPNGQLFVGFFLIDAGCLGIKDVTGFETDHSTLVKQLSKQEYVNTTPEDGLAMIAQAVAFANGLGFSPHADFAKVLPLFGDVDASLSTKVYQFGDQDGKPFYCNGPFEDAARQNAILHQLKCVVGPGNFKFVCGMSKHQRFDHTLEDIDDVGDLMLAEAEDGVITGYLK